MKQTTAIVMTYAVLIAILIGLIGWWVYDTYYPFSRPTPLSAGLTETEDVTSTQKNSDEEASTTSAASLPSAPTVDPVVKKMLPFDTTRLDVGVKIGAVTVSTLDVLNVFSTLAYNTSRDLSDFALWQEAANKVSRQAITIDEAVKRGYILPKNESLTPEIISSATVFLENSLKTEKKPVTVDDLIAARSDDVIVLTNTPK